MLVPAAHAAQVDIFGSFAVLGETFSPDDDFFDPDGNSGGFLSPQSPAYNDQATNTELQQNYNPDLPYGGLQWVGATNGNDESGGVPTYQGGDTYAGAPIGDFENKWVNPAENLAFDTLNANWVIDFDDFAIDNVQGSNLDALNDPLFSLLTTEINPFSVAPATSTFEAFLDGEFIGGEAVPLTATAAIDSTDGSGNPDVLIIAAVNQNTSGPDDNDQLFTLAIIGDGNWFETTTVDNLLNDIADKERRLTIEELSYGFDGEGFVPLGKVELQGVNVGGLSIEQRGFDETTALLPDAIDEETGAFEFTIDPSDFVDTPLVWIDPEIAVGYTYQITNEDGIVAITGGATPSQDAVANDGGYIITVTHIIDGATGELIAVSGDQYTFSVDQGTPFSFDNIDGDVGKFELTGINPALMLDPEDTTIFQTGLSFFSTSAVTATQTPITVCEGADCEQTPPAVPLPLPAVMLLTGLAGLGALRKVQKKS